MALIHRSHRARCAPVHRSRRTGWAGAFALVAVMATLPAGGSPAPARASTICPPGDTNPADCAVLPALAVTASADAIRAQTVTLHAAVDGFGEQTQYYFQWGESTRYGQTTKPGTLEPCSSGPASCLALPGTLVASTVHHLTPATTYHFRILAANADGTTIGADRSFSTTPLDPLQYVHAAHTVGHGHRFPIAVALRVAAKLTIRVLTARGRVVSTTAVTAARPGTIHPTLPGLATPGAYSLSVSVVGGGTTRTLVRTLSVA